MLELPVRVVTNIMPQNTLIVPVMPSHVSSKRRLLRRMENMAKGLLFADYRLYNYQIACPVCGRLRDVQRTDFWWSLKYPKVSAFLMPYRLNNVTSFLRTLPDFLIIGIAKSGTTSLYGLISAHPNVVPARVKEVHYFTDSRHYEMGTLWYRAKFPSVLYKRWLALRRHGQKILSGEASSTYLFHPMVPGRAKALLPDVKLIVILRNPVDRAYSEYHMQIRDRYESLTFEDAIEAEKDRISYEMERVRSDPQFYWSNLHHYSYLQKGHYAEQLTRWFRYYDKDRFLILTMEELEADQRGVLDRVFEFLGLEPFDVSGLDSLPSHSWTKQFIRKPSDETDRGLLNAYSYGAMKPKTRAMLLDYFKPHNKRLSELLQRDFDWDR